MPEVNTIFSLASEISDKVDKIREIEKSMPRLPKAYSTTHSKIDIKIDQFGKMRDKVSFWIGPIQYYDVPIFMLQELAAIVQKVYGIPEIAIREEKK